MSVPNQSNRKADLEQRERDLRQRELELRVRELEGELHRRTVQSPDPKESAGNNIGNSPEPTVTPTKPYRARKTRWNLWQSEIWLGFQFLLIVMGVVVAIRIANWLGIILIIGMIGWVIYKVFCEVDD